MIRLFLLGAVRLEAEVATTRRAVLSQPRRTALLAWLALRARRGPERRDTLLGVFWPESDTNHARGALRNALHYLRRTLGPDVLLSHGSDEVQFDLGAVWCDAVEFERLCDAGDHAAALRLYNGDLLEGFFVSEAPAFEQWLEIERHRLRLRAAEAARILAATAEAENEPQLAALRLRHLLELAPTDEAAVRDLMRLLSVSDDRGGALRVYDELRGRLQDEYGLEPSEDTAALAARIRAAPHVVSMTHEPVGSGVAPPESAHAAQDVRSTAPPAPVPLFAAAAASRRTRRAIALFALVVGLATLTAGLTLLHGARSTPLSSDVIAIFPFEYRGAPEHAYIAEGLADLLAANLHGAGDLTAVDPRILVTRARRPAPPPADAQRAAAARGAALFVLGSVTEVAGRLRVTASLYEAGGRHAPRTTDVVAEGPLHDVLEMVDRLSLGLLQLRGTTTMAQAALRTTTSVEALRAFLRAEAALGRMDVQQAIEQLRDATLLDSTFAMAHYRLSSTAYRFGQAELAEPAAIAALRHAHRLAPADSLLVAGWYHHMFGSIEQAADLYQRALVHREAQAEAAFQLGELRFHWGSLIGVPAAEARDAFDRVLAAEPDHVEAALHLARLAAREARVHDVDSLITRMRRVDPGGWWEREMGVMRAFMMRDTAAQQQALTAAGAHVDWILENVTANTGNLADVERALLPRLGLERDADGLPRAHLFVTHVRIGRGRFADALRGIEDARMLPDARRLEYRAMMATVPFRSLTTEELRTLRDELAAYPETAVAPADMEPYGAGIEHPAVMWPGMWRPRRLYLLGALHVRLGDHTAASAVADSLALLAAAEPFAAHYERLTRARLLAARGNALGALRTLGHPQRPPLGTFESFVDHGRVYERWLRAELLHELGRPADALRWFATFPDPMGRDLVYLAPSHLRRAEIYDAAGNHDEAAVHYRRFIDLWSDADPGMQHEVEMARARLRTLTVR
ncbi:hypothetical protein BH23GEM9_BH23GEM9_22310 [soil metagenome]